MNSQLLPPPEEAAAEILRRRRAREGLLGFTAYTKEDYEVNWHHAILCDYLDKFIGGQIKRLMVFMPPRHGKSELVSRRLPAYILGRNPDAQIIACSYSADLASRMNRDVQRIIDDERYSRLFPDTRLFGANVRTVAQGTYLRNSDIFEVVGHGGCYRSAGVGGGITGMGFNYGIIDDPIKNREEAESITYRDNLWDWYTSTFYTRQEKGGAILITVTRWHMDDIAGRLIELAQADHAEPWTIIRFPALKDEADPHDPREIGEPLWPNKYDAEALGNIRIATGAYQWASLYQQRPAPLEGGLFKAGRTPFVDVAPADAKRIRWWDIAATAGDGNYTVGALLSRVEPGMFFVEDVIRGRWDTDQRDAIIRQTAELDMTRGHVRQFLPQDPGQAGKSQVAAFTRLLSGLPVYTERETGDKVVRADPFASQWNAGNVSIVRAAWNRAYLEELLSFPNGQFDDQVDASSGAFNKLAEARRPLVGAF